MSPKSVLPLQRNESLSPSEIAPVKPTRLESGHEVIDHSGHTISEDKQSSIDSSFKSPPRGPIAARKVSLGEGGNR